MKISINEPCHENWDDMNPNEKGAFCLSCQKNVVDFSSKTIYQIKDFFRKKTGSESVCGRFEEEQLDALTFDDFFGRFRKWQFLHKTAVIVFFVFGLALFGNAQTAPKEEPKAVMMGKVMYAPKDTAKKTCGKDTLVKPTVKGRVKHTSPKAQKQNTSPKLMGDIQYVPEEKRKSKE